ncbi:MAG: phosphoenolpyruvate carboxykinase (GTP) [Planctomycetota bacterium]
MSTMEGKTVANYDQVLKNRISGDNLKKLMALENRKVHEFLADTIELTNPSSVFVCTNSDEDTAYIRKMAITNGEEKPLAMPGHTCHFDSYEDQGRDKANTKYLLPPDTDLGEQLNSMDKTTGTKEIRSLLKDSMKGREMLVCFFCLGPTNSEFAIPSMQITDSSYVAHSESMLYRPGYEQFRSIGNNEEFFRFLHSQGELENGVSKNTDQKRIYIDLEDNIVYSVNTQYAGNTVGLKKLALRLAIQKGSREGWLAEHMFLMGAHGPGGRVTYFAGAFPSACGKTSTSMIPGQTIIGDDIAYFRKKDGQFRAANVEKGIFGIIADVNSQDDPIIYEALTSPGEVIFTNVLITDDLKPHWLGMGCELPKEGTNHSGRWQEGKKDEKGNVITASHKNARYTVALSSLSNRDPLADDPDGVVAGGIIYGGRDSNTWVPVEQAFGWDHGIITKGAMLESETTSATLGSEGIRSFNLMSNIDFLSIPLGRYIQNNLDFAKGISKPPLIFSVNYFLKDRNGKYINSMADKKVWILWAELRVHGDVEAIETPTGYIPKYKDLAQLFKEQLNHNYTQADYITQFTIRTGELLAKIDRIEKTYGKIKDTPQIVFESLQQHRRRIRKGQDKHGDYINPFDLEMNP